MTEVAEEQQVEEPEVEPETPDEPDEPEDNPEEPETGDEPETSDEPDLAAEVQVDFSERAVKAREKALEKEHKRHEGVLERAWGTLWDDFQLCPLCEGDGFMVPRPAGSMDADQFAAVTAFAGQMQAVELQNDADYVCCDNCGGWGQTNIKDSKREGLSKQCDRCLGLGYTKTTAVNVIPFVPTIPNVGEPPAAPTIQSYGAPGPDDQWGRPTGHPHYGIPPAAVT